MGKPATPTSNKRKGTKMSSLKIQGDQDRNLQNRKRYKSQLKLEKKN